MPGADDRPTLLYRLYCGFTALLQPLAWRTVRNKLRAADVPENRERERLGHASLPRPSGRLIWFHAASVGESLSVLSLIKRLADRLPDAEFLITSGTPTSAALIAKRMPPRTRHQYPPLDTAGPVTRFLSHWRPDAGIFVESEIWPRLIVESRRQNIPLALLNARLSEKSVRGWKKRPDTARFILSKFRLFLTQNDKTAASLIDIGATPSRVQRGTNLKAMSDPLPVDQATLQGIQTQIADRPVWIASSTHAGEEETVLTAHKTLLERWPNLLLLLIPRHPERRDDIAALIKVADMPASFRSRGELIRENTQIYVADTLGETGTWYALCPIVFLGGSLKEIGGHNPFEPAQAGAAVITGPGYFNFAETFAPLIKSGGAIEVQTAAELSQIVAHWLSDQSALQSAQKAAQSCVHTQSDALESVIDTLCAELDLH
ncbi:MULTISPECIES: 3-deoxy-D-manno-octulosonic acid transferase [unclassified Ruegeria]|uniref:3-deoxy-D-manno-octulosonic acid transferase n=1 Tax=unclassified Ruegeria TaxID=2625375 RepID=UPI0014888762|nr:MULTISPECIES: 3-deoxy-D-manno-octulosonic acid transferase [unclassified Ruegeria]NOD61815.1 3-deoxy-D-manno-octulosonic acid transferase [Ruegeria sp. HKCCD6109]